jgi:hypothetical protein
MLAPVLGFGGLQRERAHGSASFTLALPVSRLALIAARAAVGLLEILALALLPVILVPALSKFVGEAYPLSQALEFSLLWGYHRLCRIRRLLPGIGHLHERVHGDDRLVCGVFNLPAGNAPSRPSTVSVAYPLRHEWNRDGLLRFAHRFAGWTISLGDSIGGKGDRTGPDRLSHPDHAAPEFFIARNSRLTTFQASEWHTGKVLSPTSS